MADRQLRELERAAEQRIARLEAQVRDLRLRTYPAALRYRLGIDITPPSPSTYSTLVSVQISPGRWLALGQTVFSRTTSAGTEHFALTIEARSSRTAVPISPPNLTTTVQQWRVAHTGGSQLYVPMTVTAEINVDEVIAVNLVSTSVTAAAYTAVAPTLVLLPM